MKTIQRTQSTTKRIDVTDLTPIQQKELFVNYLNQAYFLGFYKLEVGKKTYYTFLYTN
jgi:hypothetical protein